MSSIMRCRSGLMALSVMRDAPVFMEVANPSSQDRTPRCAIVLAVSAAAAPYRASGLALWRKADIDQDTASQVLNPLHRWAAKRGDSSRSGCEVESHRRPRGRRISLRGFCGRRRARYDSRGADEAELLQGRYPIVKTDFLEDHSVLEFQHGRAGEFHLAAGVGRQ